MRIPEFLITPLAWLLTIIEMSFWAIGLFLYAVVMLLFGLILLPYVGFWMAFKWAYHKSVEVFSR